MQYDILASAPLVTTGQVTDNAASPNNLTRLRIKGLYFVSGATAGSVTFRDGGSGGPVLLTMNTPASAASGSNYIIMPGEGILVGTNLHGTVSTTTSVVVFYG